MSDSRREAAKERRAEKLKDPKFRASETLRKAKQTDIKGGPSVKRGDPVPQEVIPVKKKPVPEIGGFQPNTFKPQTGQQTFDKMFGPDSKVRRIQTGEKPVIPDPFGDKTKPRKSRTIPFKDRKQLDPETQKKVDAVTPAFATRIGTSGKPIPVSMRNRRVPSERSIEKLKPSQKGNIIVKPGKTKPKDPGIDPEVTTDSPRTRTQTQTGTETGTKKARNKIIPFDNLILIFYNFSSFMYNIQFLIDLFELKLNMFDFIYIRK